MAIRYSEDNSGLRTSAAVERVNSMFSINGVFSKHYASQKFHDFIPDMANTSLANIVLLMKAHLEAGSIEVKHWKPFNRWTRAIAMTRGKSINLNVRKMYRPIGDIINTIVHETVHIVDGQHTYSFGHGNNNPKGKQKTAPYLLGRLSEEYYESGKLYTVEELQAL